MGTENVTQVEIKKLEHRSEAETCARMMASSEPWITLRRNYDACLKIVTDPSRKVYLVTGNGEILGFIVLNLHGAFVGYIQSIGVAPSWRSKGIGRQLVAFAEERIFRESPNAFICVSSFNKDAQRFYERLGYQVIGELKDYIVSGHSEILLRKTIAPLADFQAVRQGR